MRVRLDGVRFNYVWVRDPKVYTNDDGSENSRYEAVVIVEPGSQADKAVDKAILDTAEEKWGEKAAAILKKLRSQDRVCYKDGNNNFTKDGEIRDGFADMMYFRPYRHASKGPVKVLNEFGKEITAETWSSFPTSDPGHPPRNGDYGAVMVNFWAQDSERGGQRINAELEIIMHTHDGDPLGSADLSDAAVDDFASAYAKEQPTIPDDDAPGLRK